MDYIVESPSSKSVGSGVNTSPGALSSPQLNDVSTSPSPLTSPAPQRSFLFQQFDIPITGELHVPSPIRPSTPIKKRKTPMNTPISTHCPNTPILCSCQPATPVKSGNTPQNPSTPTSCPATPIKSAKVRRRSPFLPYINAKAPNDTPFSTPSCKEPKTPGHKLINSTPSKPRELSFTPQKSGKMQLLRNRHDIGCSPNVATPHVSVRVSATKKAKAKSPLGPT